MSWRKISMKFPGKCIVCNEKIEIDEIVMWAKGLGVKHEKCAQIKELTCAICGGLAGCSQCEFQDICDLEIVSQLCVCKNCGEHKNIYQDYVSTTLKKYPSLNLLSNYKI